MLIWIVVMVAAVLADQLTKQLVVNFLDREEPFYIIKDVLYNKGRFQIFLR